jgi:hypothetical protein
MTTHKSTRVTDDPAGGYDYRGFRLQHPENENGTISNDWDILERIDNEWIACDRVKQLWYAKQMIDGTSR